MGAKRGTATERFWRFVIKTDGGCWEWSGCRTAQGYGQLRVGNRSLNAHRLSWEMHVGPIPEGMLVCHHCDNRPCVNPAHLFVGDYKDNARDMVNKGRDYRGERLRGSAVATSKLVEDQIPGILARVASGESQPRIAREHGVSTTVINNIARGKAWQWLASI